MIIKDKKAEIVNVSVDESVLTDGKVDLSKVKPIAFDPFTNSYNVLGEKVGTAWGAGKNIYNSTILKYSLEN